MLLLHQVGSLKIGEVVRYTLTYTPSQDRILPSPEKLYVRIRNTSAIALRAAFVHGPYTLSVAAYPTTFDPNEKCQPRQYGVPAFEPLLKAGGSWEAELTVPDDVRQGAGTGRHGGFGKPPEHDEECARWIIEVSSQVIFSTSAAVGYEMAVARDRKSLNLSSSLPVVGAQAQVSQPGRISDYQQSVGAKDGHHPAQPKGIFSRAVHVKVEDTATLWNTPRLPGWDDAGDDRIREQKQGADEPTESVVDTGDPETRQEDTSEKANGKKPEKNNKEAARKQKKIHLVVLTHGLHSNLGADMLFMKESIDTAVKQAKIDRKARKEREQASRGAEEQSKNTEDEDDDDEEVIVRGYSGNATKTERGIKFLGKRLARYVLSMTYPDQPYLPLGKGSREGFAQHHDEQRSSEGTPSHKHSTIHTDGHRDRQDIHKRAYKITSISFIAHSLGGLIQTYAVAYIQKHSPDFFNSIRPEHFICLATPFLGLSNENPLYVKFALDFGLVGRTGKDLGLTWRAPTIARSGWGAIVGNLGETAHKKVYGETQPESKPLLRILPTGPAHTALKKFRNRTVYSNVVNDGIVPLRTSCLLFLDWQGLGRVEKARRDAGLVETMVGFGWAELTGTKLASLRPRSQVQSTDAVSDTSENPPREGMRQVPQPDDDAIEEDDKTSLRSVRNPVYGESSQAAEPPANPLAGFFNLFKSSEPPKPQVVSHKQKKILRRGQTLSLDEMTSDSDSSRPSKVTTGNELEEDPAGMMAPPRTTFFESAGDLLNPKVPDMEYLTDPSKRPRTIFHDRVYHPTDIPPLPLKKRNSSLIRRKTFNRSSTGQSAESGSSSPYLGINHEDSTKDYDDTANTNPDKQPNEVVDNTNVRVEEKIARGYHRDLSWRKVLVKLEPDAHNNIFVRRMFANAYGWPVIKHLVDVHFSDSSTARGSTAEEHLGERALPVNQPPDEHGGETKGSPSPPQTEPQTATDTPTITVSPRPHNESEAREALDEVPDLPNLQEGDLSLTTASGSAKRSRSAERPSAERADSMAWSDRDWADSESDRESSADGKEVGDKGREGEGRSSPSWNWTEKIVGRGAGRAKSPTDGAAESHD